MKHILTLTVILFLFPTLLFAQSEIVPITEKLQCRWELNSGPELYKDNNGLVTKSSFSTVLRKNKRKVGNLQRKKRDAATRKQKRRLGKKIKAKQELAETIRECEDGTLDGLCCLTCVSPTC